MSQSTPSLPLDFKQSIREPRGGLAALCCRLPDKSRLLWEGGSQPAEGNGAEMINKIGGYRVGALLPLSTRQQVSAKRAEEENVFASRLVSAGGLSRSGGRQSSICARFSILDSRLSVVGCRRCRWAGGRRSRAEIRLNGRSLLVGRKRNKWLA